MHLILTIEQGDAGLAQPSVRFGAKGGTVGRGAGRDLKLPDPDCYISSLHVAIDFEDGRFVVTDKSTNGTFYNAPDRLIGRDRTTPLASGDRLFIGDYVLVAEVRDEQAHEQAPSVPPASDSGRVEGKADASPPSAPDIDAEPFSLPWDGDEDPSAGLDVPDESEVAGEDDDSESQSPPNLSPEREFFAAPGSRRGDSQLIPEDWDKFLTGFFETPASEPPASEPPASDAQASDAQTSDAQTSDAQAPRPPRPEPKDRSAGGEAIDAGSSVADTGPAQSAEADGRKPVDEPPRRGVTPAKDRRQTLNPDALHEALETVTGGLMALLHSRSEIKNEFRIEQTRFIRTENNPLKFSPSAEEAMRRVFGTSDEPGFVTGSQAYREAIDDLQAHQFALMSAVQEAIESAIRQFNPVQLEERLKKISPLSARTPGLKAARCWGLFTSHYDEVAAALRDDARKVFLQAFADAYERAVRDISASRADN